MSPSRKADRFEGCRRIHSQRPNWGSTAPPETIEVGADGLNGHAGRRSRSGRAEQFGEITLAHQRRGHAGGGNTGRQVLAPALVIHEGEQLVSPERSAQRGAELVAAQFRGRLRRRCVVESIRSGDLGTVESVENSVNLVGADLVRPARRRRRSGQTQPEECWWWF